MSDKIMTQRSDGTWGQSIPEPLWVRPWYLVGPSKPSCCGVTFRTRERYEEHYGAKHFTRPCGARKQGYFCASPRNHEGKHQSCGGMSWLDPDRRRP